MLAPDVPTVRHIEKETRHCVASIAGQPHCGTIFSALLIRRRRRRGLPATAGRDSRNPRRIIGKPNRTTTDERVHKEWEGWGQNRPQNSVRYVIN